MKISIYSTKGWAGKTPIATNIVLDRRYGLATNEPYHVFDNFIPGNQLLHVDLNDSFPEVPDSIDLVFDLAWSISKTAHSITSAIKQSDLVLVPIYNEVKSIEAGLHTIAEILHINQNVAVIATKLQRKKSDILKDWLQCWDFQNIRKAVQGNINHDIPILPLKFSMAFDLIFENEMSISQLRESSGLAAYHYKEVAKQFEEIYQLIDQYCAK